MILFLGTRPGKKTKSLLEGVTCPYCGQKETLSLTLQTNYFHLFWLPILKIGTSRYAECSHCKRFFYKKEFTSEMERVAAR
ncbi:MAG: zinc-ribbon domain-containing protein [Croceitalea sp.]|nr:zinc ribbon domain-containing protein [Croceitalea sp.]NNM19538.1 zinc-ribbon domain-containing protein [Croceitalea sp.]